MIRRLFCLLAVFVIGSVSARAQFGIYGTVTGERLSGVGNFPTYDINGLTYRDYVNPLGGTGGIYYDFRSFGPVRIGVDVRGSILTSKRGAQAFSLGNGTRVNSALGGVRASFHTPIAALKPYIQASAGLGRSDYGLIGPVLKNNFEYHIFGGLDINLLPFMDFRAVELGYGGLNAFGSASHNYPLTSISTGIVFHLPSLP